MSLYLTDSIILHQHDSLHLLSTVGTATPIRTSSKGQCVSTLAAAAAWQKLGLNLLLWLFLLARSKLFHLHCWAMAWRLDTPHQCQELLSPTSTSEHGEALIACHMLPYIAVLFATPSTKQAKQNKHAPEPRVQLGLPVYHLWKTLAVCQGRRPK